MFSNEIIASFNDLSASCRSVRRWQSKHGFHLRVHESAYKKSFLCFDRCNDIWMFLIVKVLLNSR